MNRLVFDSHVSAYVDNVYSWNGPDRFTHEVDADFTVARVSYNDVQAMNLTVAEAKQLRNRLNTFLARVEKRTATVKDRAASRTAAAREKWDADRAA